MITSIEERENLKNQAVTVRESGKLDEALQMFEEVAAWDRANSNNQGLVDVLGYIRIIWSHKLDKAANDEEKVTLVGKINECVDETTRVLKATPDIPDGAKAIAKVHNASALFSAASVTMDQIKKDELLNKALAMVDEAIVNLPGSKAHKAWPMLAKARCLTHLKRCEESMVCLQEGEKNLYEGYEEELANGDQSEIKLNVWLAGIFLGKAELFKETNKPILAKHYASAVLAIEDPQNMLGQRKEQARMLLETLK